MEKLIKESKNCIKNRLLITFKSKKFLLSLILLVTNLHMIVSPLKSMTKVIPINPFIAPFIIDNRYEKILIIIPIILLLNDFGKITRFDEQLIIRTNRNCFLVSNIISILITSVIYFTLIILLIVLILLPYIDLSMDFGKCIDTLIKTNAAINYKITLGFSVKIYEYFTPLQSNIFYLLLNSLSGFIIGLIIFFFNLFNKPLLSNCIPTIFLVVDAIKDLKIKSYKYNFISWVNLSNIKIDEITPFYSINEIMTRYMTLIILLILITFLCFRKRDF